jgi:hypothetical protein
MSVNTLMDKAQAPDDALIQRSLGETWAFFDELRTLTAVCEQDWRHYGKKYGWKLKIHADGKSLLELTVADGWFMVAMAIREKERLDLAADPAVGVLRDLAGSADAAPEGYGIRIEVRDRLACQQVKALVRFIMGKRSLGQATASDGGSDREPV